jgi:hypothetical protein
VSWQRGDKAVMFHSPGNPYVTVDRGAHSCMAAQPAMAQLLAQLRELPTKLPSIQAGEPTDLSGTFIHAVKSTPFTF